MVNAGEDISALAVPLFDASETVASVPRLLNAAGISVHIVELVVTETDVVLDMVVPALETTFNSGFSVLYSKLEMAPGITEFTTTLLVAETAEGLSVTGVDKVREVGAKLWDFPADELEIGSSFCMTNFGNGTGILGRPTNAILDTGTNVELELQAVVCVTTLVTGAVTVGISSLF